MAQTNVKTVKLLPSQIDEAALFLKRGELVALPTETVYGLAADAKNEEAILKIFTAKDRPLEHPLILHLASFGQVDDWVEDYPSVAKKLADHFWPGPLTMIFRKKNHVSNLITGGLNTVAIRFPNHTLTKKVIEKLGNGIVAPSANKHKRISPTSVAHVLKTLDGEIAAVLDGGKCSVGLESTILDMTKNVPVILRCGSITPSMLEEILKIRPKTPLMHSEKVSGNMIDHYKPKAPLFILSTFEIESLLLKETNVAVVYYSNILKNQNIDYYQMPSKKIDYAKMLYETLHQIDSTSIDKIFVEMPPKLEEWYDVYDRLQKAAFKMSHVLGCSNSFL